MATLPPIHPNLAPRTNSIDGIPVREDVLFTNAKGEEKADARTLAESSLEKLSGVLPRLLESGETVLYITAGVAPMGVLEQLQLGAYAFYLKGITLVFTDRRLLRFRRKSKGMKDWQWTRGVKYIRWGDVAKATVKGWLTRVLNLEYRSGKKESYRITGFAQGKKVSALMPSLVLPGTGGTGAPSGQDMVSVCPDCLKPLTPQVYQCPGCGLTFKNEKTLLWRNFLVPGGGFFYTGWNWLGFAQLFPDILLSIGFLWFLLVAARVVPPPAPDAGEKAIDPAGAVIVAVMLLVILFLENGISWFHTRRLVRDFIPER